MSRELPRTADVFCRVVDNFGDAGVCWRLARRLLTLGVAPRLICDRIDVLAKLVPMLSPGQKDQTAEGVRIVDWDVFAGLNQAAMSPAELVLETFGCRLPEAYERAVAECTPSPFWVNLDYLSAEDWVEDCHDVWGMHPTLPVRKLWFFPGFTDRTGGLLIEDDYIRRRSEFIASGGREAFLASVGADPALSSFFVFCYPVNDLASLAGMFGRSTRPRNVLLAPGEAGDRLEELLRSMPHLVVRRTPFVPQAEFDALLWSMDAAVVRGEDSFVRAQLAMLPFLWAVYPTEDLAHRIKLDAWLEKRTASGTERAANTLWVQGSGGTNVDAALDAWLAAADDGWLRADILRWSESLFARGDLARRLLMRTRQA